MPGVGTPWWAKKRGGIRYQLAIPANLARVVRQQAQQRAQQRGLAAADPPGDHRERPAQQAQVDAGNAVLAAGVAVAEAAHVERF